MGHVLSVSQLHMDQTFVLDWSANFFLICGCCVPVYHVVRQAKRGVLAGALWFWVCATTGLILTTLAGNDMDLAPGCYLVSGWLLGLLYCLPILAVVGIWRAWRPNPHGYCRKCGRALKADQAHCPVGHPSLELPRGFEVIPRRRP
jgi:predicted membrane channel-forming protein YqfA (hemolysin III family)